MRITFASGSLLRSYRPPSHGHGCDFLLVCSGLFQKAGRREVAFTQKNKPSEPVQNRFKIQMVRKSEPEIEPVRKRTIPFPHMNKKGRSSSGPLSGPAGFLWEHASAFHLLSSSILEKISFPAEAGLCISPILSPSILEKLSFPAEVPVFFIFRHKLLNFNLIHEPPNSFFEIILPMVFFKFL